MISAASAVHDGACGGLGPGQHAGDDDRGGRQCRQRSPDLEVQVRLEVDLVERSCRRCGLEHDGRKVHLDPGEAQPANELRIATVRLAREPRVAKQRCRSRRLDSDRRLAEDDRVEARDACRSDAVAGIDSMLDVVVASLEEGVEKPEPMIFKIALDRLGADPAETLHVGDSPLDDVQGARNAGLKAILLDRRKKGPPSKTVISDLMQLTEVLDWIE